MHGSPSPATRRAAPRSPGSTVRSITTPSNGARTITSSRVHAIAVRPLRVQVLDHLARTLELRRRTTLAPPAPQTAPPSRARGRPASRPFAAYSRSARAAAAVARLRAVVLLSATGARLCQRVLRIGQLVAVDRHHDLPTLHAVPQAARTLPSPVPPRSSRAAAWWSGRAPAGPAAATHRAMARPSLGAVVKPPMASAAESRNAVSRGGVACGRWRRPQPLRRSRRRRPARWAAVRTRR